MEIRAARIQDSYFLPGAQTLPTSPQTARPQPAQQTFFSLFLFRATKPYFTPTNSNSLAQILPLLNQIQAAHRPRANSACAAVGSVLATRATPSRRPGGHSPICARLSCTRQSPQTARHPNLSMVLQRTTGASEWSWRVLVR